MVHADASRFLHSMRGLGRWTQGKKGELALALAAHTGCHLYSKAAAPNAGGLRSIMKGAIYALVIGRCHHEGCHFFFFPLREQAKQHPTGRGPHTLQKLEQ